ncbi:hypothetical protein [Mesorhizobium sp. M00.F.Ca.ET.220.01.1.1]|nr:hypothetical protein [Mesorhizobium sp. M00.F.Ca.ET.220.01.1.1]
MAVRIKVAKSELMVSMPTLAKIAVSAAKAADSSAQNCQEEAVRFISGGLVGFLSAIALTGYRETRTTRSAIGRAWRLAAPSALAHRFFTDIAAP